MRSFWPRNWAISEMEREALEHKSPGTEPYRPSRIHQLYRWIDRLPGPYWLVYVGIVLIVGLLNHIVAWKQQVLPLGEISWPFALTAFFLAVHTRCHTHVPVVRSRPVPHRDHGSLLPVPDRYRIRPHIGHTVGSPEERESGVGLAEAKAVDSSGSPHQSHIGSHARKN
jgi:hypothetical protein